MDFHLDRQLRLKTVDEIELKRLYQRAVIEVDERGEQVGEDQIPWGWTLCFYADEIIVTDSLGYESKDGLGRERACLEATYRRGIRMKLRPGQLREGELWGHEPTYRMFGVDRRVGTFQLDIRAATADVPEGCTAWASVSYTSEIDFRSETTDDILQFYLTVPQTTYDQYVWNLAQGMADEVIFAVGFVDGFYSTWSPSISTKSIKILAGSEHVVDGEREGELPRIGAIGKAELYMNARRRLTARWATSSEFDGSQTEEAPASGRQSGFRWPRGR